MKNGLTINKYGNKRWYKDDFLHREDGPAREWDDGTKEWWINGQRHRLDGPACEWSDGGKEWWYQGQYVNCGSQEDFNLWLRTEKLKAFW